MMFEKYFKREGKAGFVEYIPFDFFKFYNENELSLVKELQLLGRKLISKTGLFAFEPDTDREKGCRLSQKGAVRYIRKLII